MNERDLSRDRGRERDLVLAPNEFAFISDETKGNINVYVGPHKTSLANTDQPVIFNYESKRFARVTLEQAIQVLSVAPEGWYLVLKNPARDGSHPRTGALNNLPELDVGRKVNTPGPVSYALWPGQMVKVVPGHSLRSNQYLLVRVYDEEAAKTNWAKAVIKRQTAPGTEPAPASESSSDGVLDPSKALPELTMGKHLVIRGTDVSFYIPPTGVEVVADEQHQYVRDAATLERLEYCILLDEDGNKRFIQGPAVVFPRPTETFIERNGSRKFRAIELTEIAGVYVKVIAPYEEGGRAYKVGDELFITGKEQMIYFPRPEHALIRYGGREIHYGVAIPAGEARYVLDRTHGNIRLERGPSVFLPDPRKEVIVRRVLDPRTVELLFPGNRDALEYNARLSALKRSEAGNEFVVDDEARQLSQKGRAEAPAQQQAQESKKAEPAFVGDAVSRNQSFTAPRTIVLDTRYEGAISIDLWTGYAVLVKSRSGKRRVEAGPTTFLLEYDESLQPMELSTGTPKTDDKVMRTAYLRVKNNKVSDLVEAETADLVKVRMKLSYRVDFEGDSAQWFSVENYVKFLTEHLRSLLRHAVKQHGVEHFYGSAVSILRDVILGPQSDDAKRAGRRFAENGMRVYDVEVLDVTIGDEVIAKLLVEAQHSSVQQALAVATEKRKLELTRARESARQESATLESQTKIQLLEIEGREVERRHAVELERIKAETESKESRHRADVAVQSLLDAVAAATLARDRAKAQFADEVARAEVDRALRELDGEVRATAEKAKAISPDLIAALQAFGDKALAEKMAESMGPLAILGGESVSDVLRRLLEGTAVSEVLGKLVARKDRALPEGGSGE
jgi:major vault protein